MTPRIDGFGACGSASLQNTTQLRHASQAPGLRFCGDPKGVVECPPGHVKRGVGIRVKFFLSGFASSWGHLNIKLCKSPCQRPPNRATPLELQV